MGRPLIEELFCLAPPKKVICLQKTAIIIKEAVETWGRKKSNDPP